MPIRADLLSFYRGPAWREFRARILDRARGACEFCGKPANQWVLVTRDGTGRWNREIVERVLRPPSALAWSVRPLLVDVKAMKPPRARRAAMEAWTQWFVPSATAPVWLVAGGTAAEPPEHGRVFLINRSLTIAHLNHVAGDDREDNARALCEACHLRYDREHHATMRAIRKDAARPLLVAIAEATSMTGAA